MANPIQNFIRRAFGNKPDVGNRSRDLLPFGEFAPWLYEFQIEDYSIREQLEKYTGWVYDCVSKIAQEFAAVNLKLYKMDKDGKVEEVKTHAALDLLDRVNPFMTFYDLKELTSTNLDLTGNCYWWLLRNTQGQIIEIYPWLRPDRMTVIPDTNDFIKGYKYLVPGSSDHVMFDPSEIIHFKYINPLDPYTGYSPVSAGQLPIDTDKLAALYNRKFFKNSARPDGYLQFKDGIDEPVAKRILEKWNERHGEGNEHRIGLLSKGEYKQISVNQKDMDFAAQRAMSRDEILAKFKVPKSLLGITEDVNYATAEAARKMFLKQVIVPKVEKFVQYLNEFLLPQFADGNSYFFDYSNPVPEDQSMRIELYNAALGSGGSVPWMSINEVRALEGLAPVDGGDSIMQPFNLVPGATTTPTKSLGKTDWKKLPQKFNIRIPSRTPEAKRLEIVRNAVDESGIAVKMAKSKPARAADAEKKDQVVLQKELLSNNGNLREIWQKVWDQKINKTDNQERLMVLLMRREFSRQRDQVLKSMQEKSFGRTKSIDFNFDLDKEKDLFASVFSPLLQQIISEHGKDALALLGRGKFDSGTVARDYAKDQGLKFAKEVNDTTRQSIKDQIAAGIENGESIPQIKNRVSDVFKEASDSRANMIARTEVSRASNFGTKEGYRQSGVVTYTEWFTAGDEGVCPWCEPMNGKKAYLDSNYFDKGDSLLGNESKSIDFGYDNIGDPPLHVSCRCVLIPHTDEAEFFDKEKAQDAFDLKDFEGSDRQANTSAAEQVNQLFAKQGTELAHYGDQFDWKLQYADLNQLDYGVAGDEDLVKQYMASMKKGDKFPAITAQLTDPSGKPTVLDGAHRLEALKRLGARIIPVVVGRIPKK